MSLVSRNSAFIFGVLTTVSASAYSDGVASGVLKITEVMTRESGTHNIFLSGSVPIQGCTHNDRVVIEDDASANSALLSSSLVALTTKSDIVVSVDGCAPLNPVGGSLTAPKLIRLSIYAT